MIESDIIYKSNEIEENKTTKNPMINKNPMIKTKLSHTESRKQKTNESNYDYGIRISALDKSKDARKKKKNEKNILSKMVEEDLNKRLTDLKTDSNKTTKHNIPIAGTKTPN